MKKYKRKTKRRYVRKAAVKASRFKKDNLVCNKLRSNKKMESSYSASNRVEDITQSTVTTMDGRKWRSDIVVPYEKRAVSDNDKYIQIQVYNDAEVVREETEEMNGSKTRPSRIRRSPGYLRDVNVVDVNFALLKDNSYRLIILDPKDNVVWLLL